MEDNSDNFPSTEKYIIHQVLMELGKKKRRYNLSSKCFEKMYIACKPVGDIKVSQKGEIKQR
jgi:hypothetical protein